MIQGTNVISFIFISEILDILYFFSLLIVTAVF